MTPAGALIADEIRRDGPIPFSRFMELALYHPEHGYYMGKRDPFGKSGDFYTAEQVQPVFGRLIASYLRTLDPELNTLVELGAGRGDMAEAFREYSYIPVDVRSGVMPDRFAGFVFANEFFDALPVDVKVGRDETFREQRVSFDGERFNWTEQTSNGDVVLESCPLAIEWLDRIWTALDHGYVLILDYGYEDRERVRFPRGTLMSYHRHQALDDVLLEPGERDITAHVDFSKLMEHAKTLGFDVVRFETMGSLLLRAGEPDEFASALEADSETNRVRMRMQLKTLLFGMGEVFRALLLRKDRHK